MGSAGSVVFRRSPRRIDPSLRGPTCLPRRRTPVAAGAGHLHLPHRMSRRNAREPSPLRVRTRILFPPRLAAPARGRCARVRNRRAAVCRAAPPPLSTQTPSHLAFSSALSLSLAVLLQHSAHRPAPAPRAPSCHAIPFRRVAARTCAAPGRILRLQLAACLTDRSPSLHSSIPPLTNRFPSLHSSIPLYKKDFPNSPSRVSLRAAGAMEWADRAKAAAAVAEERGEPLGYVKVMTDEQMEVLRKQISIYATICEQLVEMHRALTEHQDSIAGMRFSNLYCDPLIVPGGHKITARQRWQPTPMQLQILESIFDQGNGTPSKQKIKEITEELSHHGQISETNVYNWFQNRRARSKRKQAATLPNNVESEAEADEESLTDKKPNSDMQLQQSTAASVHNADNISEMHHLQRDQMGGMMYGSNDNNLRSSGSSGQMSFYENIMSNPRIDHFPGKVESSRSISHLQPGEGFDMFG